MSEGSLPKKHPVGLAATIAIIGVTILVALHAFFERTPSRELRQIYYADNISPAHRIVIDRFNTLHQGSIEVIPVDLPFSKFSTNERKELLARSLRNKSDRIDVFAVDLIWVPRFSKWSHPLGGDFDSDMLDGIIASALQPCYVESTLVAMPLYLDIGLMYYRRDLLQHVPHWETIEDQIRQSITWDEFIKLKETLGTGGRPFYIFTAKDYEGLMCNYAELLVGQLSTYSNKAALDLTTQEARIALQMLMDFVQRLKMSPTQVSDFDENLSYDFMLDHDGVFCRGWPNFLENYSTFYPDTAKLRAIGRGALPHFKGMKPQSVFGGWNLMVSKYSNNKQQAIEFIRFLQTEESQKTMFEIGGYLPINRKVFADTAYMDLHPNLAYYNKLIANGFHRPALPDYTRISDIISHYVHRAIKGELTADEALRMATQEIRASNAVEE